ncbi:hypothetical protein YPSE1_45160 (plasmid) [Yersinia pseudotuberculosis]|nr:hypothetical protein YPSE1_45160 [Yersinia pseudotuberculosis]
MKTIMVTQQLENFGKRKPTPYAFREWLYRLNRKDKLPRGKYFKGKVGGKPLVILDEFYFGFGNKHNEHYSNVRNYQSNLENKDNLGLPNNLK